MDWSPGGDYPDYNSTKLELLTTEINVGHTFASLALTTTNESTRFRNRHNARKAYNIAVRYAGEVALTNLEKRKIRTGLARLKSELKLLGETDFS